MRRKIPADPEPPGRIAPGTLRLYSIGANTASRCHTLNNGPRQSVLRLRRPSVGFPTGTNEAKSVAAGLTAVPGLLRTARNVVTIPFDHSISNTQQLWGGYTEFIWMNGPTYHTFAAYQYAPVERHLRKESAPHPEIGGR